MKIIGFFTLICFLMLIVKYPLRKLGLNKLNSWFMKIHEFASLGVFIGGFIMLIKGIKNCKYKSFGVICGIIAYIVDVVLIIACHLTKNHDKKMKDHRIFSLMSSVFTALHICFLKN